ncbi:MAG: lipopolysaccharide heptosyltransferase II [Lentisphaeria bacterium]
MPDFDLYQPRIRLDWQASEPVNLSFSDNLSGVVVRAVNWLGDTLMTMPAVYQLKQMLPDGQPLAVVCPESLIPVWEAAEWVDRIIPMSSKRLQGDNRQAVRDMQPAAGVVLPNSFGSALDLFGAGIPVRIGRAGRGRGLLLTDCAPKWRTAYRLDNCHQVSHYLEMVSLLGTVNPEPFLPPLNPEISEDYVKSVLPVDSRRRTLALAPGAAYGPAKQWPVEYFHEVARWWNNTGGKVAVVGTSAERDLGDEVLRGLYDGDNLCGRTTLSELMGILKNVRCCVANDSGTMHLASALGTDGVALFGSTNPHATGPLGRGRWIVLCDGTGCAPCFARECPGHCGTPYGCLKGLRPETVNNAVSYLIERFPA